MTVSCVSNGESRRDGLATDDPEIAIVEAGISEAVAGIPMTKSIALRII
ncbi:MAG: hypothetical protein ACRD8W_31250 [Nitrososphaeraceae archaeon]